MAHHEGSQTKVVHDRAEVFDVKTEALFRYLQVRQGLTCVSATQVVLTSHVIDRLAV